MLRLATGDSWHLAVVHEECGRTRVWCNQQKRWHLRDVLPISCTANMEVRGSCHVGLTLRMKPLQLPRKILASAETIQGLCMA
jgi:hypothetical protein